MPLSTMTSRCPLFLKRRFQSLPSDTFLVPKGGLEPPCREAHEPESCVSANFTTSAHRCKRTPPPGGADQVRTDDPHNAIVVLCQLSYDPAPRQFYRTEQKKDCQSHNAKKCICVLRKTASVHVRFKVFQSPRTVRCRSTTFNSVNILCVLYIHAPNPLFFLLKRLLNTAHMGHFFVFHKKINIKKILHSAKNSHRFESCL